MQTPKISFEFFPPKSAAQERRFWRTFGALEALEPEYVSVTWGALGAASAASLAVLEPLSRETRVPVAAHLTCAGQTSGELHDILDQLAALGISRIVALRGDPSAQREEAARTRADTFGHATDLVELIALRGGFEISVSAYPETHPEAIDSGSDLHWLNRKFELGATRAITQFFFEAETFLRFRDRAVAEGIDGALVPGLLPVHDVDKVAGFARQCGASVPERLHERFSHAKTADERIEMAVDQCAGLCDELVREGVDELHLYTLNQSTLARRIVERIQGSGVGSRSRVDAAA